MIFAELFDMTHLWPIAVCGGFLAGAWWLMELLATNNQRAEQRLEEIRNPSAKRRELDSVKKGDAVTRMLEKAAPAMSKPLKPKTEAEVGKLKLALANAGFRNETAPSIFLGLKVIGLAAGFFLGGGGLVIAKGATQQTLLYAGIIAGIGFYVPSLVLRFIKAGRQQSIFLGLPDALDLLVVCVEAGLGLDQAMRKVSEEMKKSFRVISEEFSLCTFQLQMGRSRTDVLHELGYRTGVEDVRALAAILIQADKFGSSIAQALRVQSDAMRVKRRQLAEEKAAKTAVKLIFPLVLFIFPAIFIVLVGPAAIVMVNEMFPAMAGEPAP